MNELDRLLDVWEKLGLRERKLVLVYMTRLLAGQRKYGPISVDKKDWSYEAIEEALDASVYLSALLSDKTDKAFDAAVAEAEKEVIDRSCALLTRKEESGTTFGSEQRRWSEPQTTED